MFDAVLTLLAFAFVSSVTPGPNNLMLMTSGMNFGFSRSLRHIAGVVFGFPFMIFSLALGLSQVFALYPPIEVALKYACAAYLIYLAYKIARVRSKMDNGEVQAASGKPLTFLQAATFQWVNPKAWVMATTALTVYALPLENTLASSIGVALVFAFTGTFTASGWTALGDKLRLFFSSPQRMRIFNTVAALLLLLTLVPVFWPGVM